MAAARAVLMATIAFHHPAHAAEWANPRINDAFDDIWRILMEGCNPPGAVIDGVSDCRATRLARACITLGSRRKDEL